jgi:hypothetical protein
VGVALSLSVITIGSQAYFWPLLLRIAGASFGLFMRRTLIPGFAPALAGAVVWLGLRLLLPPTSWLLLGLEAAAGGLVYLGVLFLFCLDPSERRDLHAVLGRLRRRSLQPS